MKIRLLATFAAIIAWSFGVAAQAGEPLRVVTTFYPLYVAALNVTDGIAGVEVHNLAGPHVGCLHDYQVTTADARKLSEADLLVSNGAGMENFLGKIRSQNPGLRIIDASEGIPLIGSNAHVWVSPELAARQVDNIARAFSRADPDNAARYAANASVYNAKLSALAQRMKSSLAPIAGRPIITLHDTFPYFAKEFRLDIDGVIEREAGHEPSAKELAATVDLVRAKNVRVILAEPQYPDSTAQAVARETGAIVCRIDPVATGPSDPQAARSAYLRAMESNLGVLHNAFGL